VSIVQNIVEDDGWHVGEDKVLEWLCDNGTVGQIPVGFDTWTLKLRVFMKPPPTPVSTPLKEWAATPDGGTGLATVQVNRADTDDWAPGVYYYNLVRTDSAAWTVIAKGTAAVMAAA